MRVREGWRREREGDKREMTMRERTMRKKMMGGDGR